MQIHVDDEGRAVITRICDSALGYARLNAFNDVALVLNELRKQDAISQQQKSDDSGKVNSVVRSNRDGKPSADSVGTGPKA